MPINEQIDRLKNSISSQINSDTSPEQIEALKGLNTDIEAIEQSYQQLEAENAKFRDTIVRMVMTQGNAEPPKDENQEKQPRSIEEIMADKLNKK